MDNAGTEVRDRGVRVSLSAPSAAGGTRSRTTRRVERTPPALTFRMTDVHHNRLADPAGLVGFGRAGTATGWGHLAPRSSAAHVGETMSAGRAGRQAASEAVRATA